MPQVHKSHQSERELWLTILEMLGDKCMDAPTKGVYPIRPLALQYPAEEAFLI